MNCFKNICIVVLLLEALESCTEIYNPKINSVTKALVVEGMITNETGPYTIRLTEAEIFSSDSIIGSKNVTDAKLSITDNENHTYKLTEPKAGKYVTPETFTAKVGNSYKLLITTKDGNKYESNVETLLPPQTYDSIHVMIASENYLDKYQLKTVEGSDIFVDLFKSISKSDVVPACRFINRLTVQYDFMEAIYDKTGTKIGEVQHIGWRTFNLNGIENITEKGAATSSPIIQNHLIGFMPFPAVNYGILMDFPTPLIYYLRVTQYTINNDSYSFYKTANTQLSASGKIFDPISTQLQGNLKCVSNSSKIILGLFEVSSVKQHAFVIDWTHWSKKLFIVKAPVVDIPANTDIKSPTQYPKWWYHN